MSEDAYPLEQRETCEEPETFPLLIEPEALMRLISSGTPVTILDVRWRVAGPPGREDYGRGHIPGAAFVDLDADLAGDPGPAGRHPLPATEDLRAAMWRCGVSAGKRVVCYDERDSTAAARCWWTLTYFGHRAVSVLDGGMQAWRAAGGAVEVEAAAVEACGETVEAGAGAVAAGGAVEVEAGAAVTVEAGAGAVAAGGAVEVEAGAAVEVEDGAAVAAGAGDQAFGDFEPVPGHLPIVDADGAARVARAPRGVLLDARAGERYRGEAEPLDPVAGHIPGAVSAPTKDNLDGCGRWRPSDELRSRFVSLGLIDARAEVGVYCGSGVTAAHEVLAIALAGLGPVALYVGSWSEWSKDPSRPVATGPDPG